jgi:hypothetical protein
MIKLNLPIAVLISAFSLATAGVRTAQGQATATGSVTVYVPGTATQTVMGQVSLPNGYAYGSLPATVTPSLNGSGFVESLTINPGGITPVPPSTANEAAAIRLSNSTDLSEMVSIIRAGSGFSNTPVNQAKVNGSTTIINDNQGYTQTVTGSVTLPIGFYYEGADYPLVDPGCVAGSGCLVLLPSLGVIPNSSGNLGIERLLINPGTPVAPSLPYYNFSGAAASQLATAGSLSDQVSLIRAGQTLLNSTSAASQAIASGSTTLIAPDGSTQSVSGEIALANSLYYLGVQDSNCGSGPSGNGCLNITPLLGLVPGTTEAVRIEQLKIDPGNPSNPFSYFPDFNAAAANVLTGSEPEPLMAAPLLPRSRREQAAVSLSVPPMGHPSPLVGKSLCRRVSTLVIMGPVAAMPV